MNKKTHRKLIVSALTCLLVVGGLCYCFLFSAMTDDKMSRYVYIDSDDDIDSVYAKLDTIASGYSMIGFKTLAYCSAYGDKIRTGRYEIAEEDGAFTVFRKLKNGLQTSVRFTLPSVRTTADLAKAVSTKLMIDKEDLLDILTDSATCAKYGYRPETMVCMFIPNTYDMYWNISLGNFMEKMQKENKKFWTENRIKKAEAIRMTKEEVITLASIVDSETANNAEKPMVAGMYYNRLKKGMLLQADPTVIFALQDFTIRRVYRSMLRVNSPYNTYLNKGLPPGPIRIPSIAGIDAVLNLVDHDYLYMCAKEDFSGTHNFAETYKGHLENAKKYTKALNERGVK